MEHGIFVNSTEKGGQNCHTLAGRSPPEFTVGDRSSLFLFSSLHLFIPFPIRIVIISVVSFLSPFQVTRWQVVKTCGALPIDGNVDILW
ncbi:hypothetical protein L2E82_14171 [Cichorium intybus]|uniref:Uncharacterized protein n=1 Tax=Cichorium intybus TaxID=13427 RepID=A0ACB9EYL1_CICIN|nr:hypothetical protein L2E82_14171 [Cichorium intybus]